LMTNVFLETIALSAQQSIRLDSKESRS